jgi:hypothetical protein
LASRQPDTLKELIARYGVRQRDVARHARCSVIAVERLLADEAEGTRRIQPDTRARYVRAIEAAREELDALDRMAQSFVREQRSKGRLPKHMASSHAYRLAVAVRLAAVAS